MQPASRVVTGGSVLDAATRNMDSHCPIAVNRGSPHKAVQSRGSTEVAKPAARPNMVMAVQACALSALGRVIA